MKKNTLSRTASTKKIPVKKIPVKKMPVKKVSKEKEPKPFPIVGFGASAGGIEAFITVLKNLDANLGMAYVLIMHLSPSHKSALAKIMQSKTTMPVHTVKNGMEVMANHVYVIPPNTFMSLVDGHLKLAPRSLSSIGNFAVDYFLTTLASIYKNNAIGVILSGTASDGTLGLKAVKAEGGITFAQDDTAEFSGMPKSASDSGYVDFRLPPEGIAKELARLGKVPYTILPPDKIETLQLKEINDHVEDFKKILSIVKSKSGIDFFLHYKQASIYRRIVRRMVLNKFDNLYDYWSMLKTNSKEIDALYNDFLINVTNFFRDPDFYKVLTNQVFPSIVKERKLTDPIRIWAAGCATGEEAYSLAIWLMEFLEEKKLAIPIQIFASDLDEGAINKARLGIYSLSAIQGISKNHLKKYLKKIDGHYQIVKSVREVCIFSQHNLLKDPPFSRMDLISCQNVLIYLEATPQRKIIQTFHYALKPNGYLFLGKSETIGASDDLFEPLDKKIKLFSRKSTKSPQLEFTTQAIRDSSPKEAATFNEQPGGSIEKEMSKLILSRFVYPSVVLNKNLVIVQFFGVTSPYLEPVAGKASLNVLKMVKGEFVIDLGSLLQQARKTEKNVSKEGIRVYTKNILREVTIEVVPKTTSGDIFFLVVFKENAIVQPAVGGKDSKSINRDRNEKTIIRLEEELVQSREVIRTTNEEYETTYEELQTNNEEILSSNEELQSVNEELETSKEELQSSNEELTTTNEELQKRNVELSASQEELKKVNEQLEQFAFVASHDLQEPLRKIVTFSSMLSSPEANLNDYAKLYSGKINASASRMSILIRDLLSFSGLVQVENKKLARIDLNKIVKNVIEDFEIIIEEKKAIIKCSILPVVYGEMVQMNQLFHNLISNSLKFSKEKPVITISSKKANAKDYIAHPELIKKTHYVSIKVSDNGIGFDQKYATKIFVLFQKLNDRSVAEGTGLGLSLCKKIVDDHGGFIFAEGKENAGATFTIFMPID